MSDKQFYLDYAVKEVVCACMSLEIPADDVRMIRKMNKQAVSDYIDAQLSKPGADEHRGKEYYIEETDGFMGIVSIFSNEDGREELFENFESIYEEDTADPKQDELPITVDEPRYVDMAADVKVKVPRPQPIKVGSIRVLPMVENSVTKQKLYTFIGEDQRPTLEQCQTLVDGFIEIVTIKADSLVPVGSQLIVNDRGCMAGQEPLPVNPVATQLYHSTCIPGTTAMIHGHAILLVEGAQLD